MTDRQSLAARWEREHGERSESLQRARLCASLTKPWILPPDGHAQDSRLPETFQSVGSLGVTNLEGRMLSALFPPEQPWFELAMHPEVEHDESIPVKDIEALKAGLFTREVIIQAVLESAQLKTNDGGRRPAGFRSQQRLGLANILITGETLKRLTADYRLKVYRRDQYTTVRDSSGEVLSHMTREKIDPLSLPPKQVRAAGLNVTELLTKCAADRLMDLYTLVEWDPIKKEWLVSEEINKELITDKKSEGRYSSFFCTPYELAPGENYARGFIEMNLGDLRSLNELELRLLKFAHLASMLHLVKGIGCQIDTAELLRQESGGIIEGGNVSGGVLNDLTVLQANNYPDFKVVFETAERKRKDLAKAMLMEAEAIPQKERVTAYQVQRVVAELEGALGGVYSSIADDEQLPLLRRLIQQMTADKLIKPLPSHVQLRAMTGIAALGRSSRLGQILTVTDIISRLGEPAAARIDQGVLMQTILRHSNVHVRGLVKSDEKFRQEQQEAIALQTQAAAAQKAVEVTGDALGAAATKQGAAA